MAEPMASALVKRYGKDPFIVLISCLLSLRARDLVTFPLCIKLFEQARTPQELLAIPRSDLEKLLYPLGFYRKKALLLHQVSKDLIDRFHSKVPHTLKELLSIKGVGRKTANLVLGQAFDIPAICVDTHVHRISNRLGIIATKTPQETEKALMEILPPEYWVEYNRLLVMWGQNICVPISPFCSRCVLFPVCQRVGVKKSR